MQSGDSQRRNDASAPVQAPAPALPKGGGAIRGIDEKLAVNPATGTASFSIPLPLSPGRAGGTPQLALSYDSGSGNGPFGLGWRLSSPGIARKTDKGLPRYRDAEDSDVYVFSGAEDLVPLLRKNGGAWEIHDEPAEDGAEAYRVRRYRPRIESSFARIERWTRVATGDIHWRTISRDNVATLYGRDAAARIADPEDALRVFEWLVEETRDAKGNVVVYEYKGEDAYNVNRALACERSRLARGKFAQRYLKRVRYGNRVPGVATDFLFEVVLDYGEHSPDSASLLAAGAHPIALPTPEEDAQRKWPCRADAFSSHRASFEVRTYRLCRRVLVFHHVPEPDGEGLVRSLDLAYDEGPSVSQLTSVRLSGYAPGKNGYTRKSLPPTELSYAPAIIDPRVQLLAPGALDDLAGATDGSDHHWVDLDGEGIAGVLVHQAGAWFYKRNLGDGDLAPVRRVATRPAMTALQPREPQLIDVTGDGQLDLVCLGEPTSGFYGRDAAGAWQPFRPFAARPTVAWDDPNLRLVDLDGDGLADVLIAEDDVFRWYPSRGREGFGAPAIVPKASDDEKGPTLVFADAEQSVFLADMSGDGLADLVRIRNGEICYWPNLGYGRFGAKVTMDAPPRLDDVASFDPRRIRLADIDGTGTTDIVYLGRRGIGVCFNQAGNGWSPIQRLRDVPAPDNHAAIAVTDLLGRGTACLVWSTPLPGAGARHVRFVDLMSAGKPHLLISVANNMGLETRLRYASSTKFYLQDRAAGRAWATRLPFPVHVVEQVEQRDGVSGQRLVTSYRYRHGHYDGHEREFRGFGLVEQTDSESFDARAPDAFAVPPIVTRSWFHTGAYLEAATVSRQFAAEYWQGDAHPQAAPLPDTALPGDLTVLEEREACRALKGRLLRQEIYALDSAAESPHPYVVAEHNYTVAPLQPAAGARHAAFFVHGRETVDYHYERDPSDPRLAHRFTLEVNEFGDVTRAAAVAYPRRPAAKGAHPAEQAALHVVVTETEHTHFVDDATSYRTRMPCEVRTFEVTGIQTWPSAHVDPGDPRLPFGVVDGATTAAREIAYEAIAERDTKLQKRPVEDVRTLYWKDDFSGPLALGDVAPLAIPFETYRLALTTGLFVLFGARIDDALLREGGYVLGKSVKVTGDDRDDAWWIPSGRQRFDRAEAPFLSPIAVEDPFFAITKKATTIAYDAYELLPVKVTDGLGNLIQVDNDYRVLSPRRITDPNGNRSEAAFDALGMVTGTAVMGKVDEKAGDSLAGFEADLDEATMLQHLANPLDKPHAILGGATSRFLYDVERYQRTRKVIAGQTYGEPPVAYGLAREKHVSQLKDGEPTNMQHSFVFADGFGREIQKKVQAEPLVTDGVRGPPRWVGSGWTLFNNKGKPVRKFEPFFSGTHELEAAKQAGVSATLFYDPLERVVATLHPDHTYEKVVFDAWTQATWDRNDTVAVSNPADPQEEPEAAGFFARLDGADFLPSWRDARSGGQLGAAAKDAAARAAKHAGTPTVALLDTLGRTFQVDADNGLDASGKPDIHRTHTTLDIEGNPIAVSDPRQIRIAQSTYDVAGRALYESSPDSGEHWMLQDVTNKPFRRWDGPEGHVQTRRSRHVYDELRRPTEVIAQYVDGGFVVEISAEKTIYGESAQAPEKGNLRGRVYQQCDGAGVVTHDVYDFKGNPTSQSRRMTARHDAVPDWAGKVDLDPNDVFAVTTVHDALNRPLSVTNHHDGTESRPTYNEAGLLDRVEARLRGDVAWTPFVKSIQYDAKRQRAAIVYGNDVSTTYGYDPLTFRLVTLVTTRSGGTVVLQDLAYSYDPVGNVTEISDAAQNEIFRNGEKVSPTATYEYDPLYRLIRATGREHAGQHADIQQDADGFPVVTAANPNDPQALRAYVERYAYDRGGNIAALAHEVPSAPASGATWTRRYDVDPGSNRLRSSSLPGDGPDAPYSATYAYDIHGNITAMAVPFIATTVWDFKNRKLLDDLGGGGKVHYAYDAAGERVRKVWEHGGVVEERIYLGGYEIYRKRPKIGAEPDVDRQTLHVLDGTKRVAMVETKTIDTSAAPFTPTPRTRYQLGNHLGSVALELDEAGLVISYEEYHPYGTSAYRGVRSGVEVSAKRYRYTGKERDEETGLAYHSARYYAPWLGRWTSSDPAGMVDGTNLYGYTRANPIGFHDPSGNDTTLPPAKARPKPPPAHRTDAEIKSILRVNDEQLNVLKRTPGIDLDERVQNVLQRKARPADPIGAVREKVNAEATETLVKAGFAYIAATVAVLAAAVYGPAAVAAGGRFAASLGARYTALGITVAGALGPRLTNIVVGVGNFIAGAAGVDTGRGGATQQVEQKLEKGLADGAGTIVGREISNPEIEREAKIIVESALEPLAERFVRAGVVVNRNREQGNSAARALFDFLRRQGVDVMGEEVFARTPIGGRRLDGLAVIGNMFVNLESKIGNAQRSVPQELKDAFMRNIGAVLTGKNAPLELRERIFQLLTIEIHH